MNRIITNTLIYLTSDITGETVSFGEDCDFDIYDIKGLDIGDIEKEVAGNALNDGSIHLGSRISQRTLDIKSEWLTLHQRTKFKDFFNHKAKFDVKIIFNGANYYGTCVLNESYNTEDNNGSLYSGSQIELSLLFPDPYLYTDVKYSHSIGYEEAPMFWFSKFIEDFHTETGGVFGIIQEPNVYIINNPNSTPNGVEITIKATNVDLVNPIITNQTTGKYTKLLLTVEPDDILFINTQLGKVECKLNGADVIKFLAVGSDLIQVINGDNNLIVSADTGGQTAYVKVEFRQRIIAL